MCVCMTELIHYITLTHKMFIFDTQMGLNNLALVRLQPNQDQHC